MIVNRKNSFGKAWQWTSHTCPGANWHRRLGMLCSSGVLTRQRNNWQDCMLMRNAIRKAEEMTHAFLLGRRREQRHRDGLAPVPRRPPMLSHRPAFIEREENRAARFRGLPLCHILQGLPAHHLLERA